MHRHCRAREVGSITLAVALSALTLAAVACRKGSSLLDDPTPAISAWNEKLGSAAGLVAQIRITDSVATIAIQDPDEPGNVEAYTFAGGTLSPAEPVGAYGNPSCWLPTASISLDALPAILRDARARVTLDSVTASSVTLWPCSMLRDQWTYVADGPRGMQSFTYSLAGVFTNGGQAKPSAIASSGLPQSCESYLAAERACYGPQSDEAFRLLRDAWRSLTLEQLEAMCRPLEPSCKEKTGAADPHQVASAKPTGEYPSATAKEWQCSPPPSASQRENAAAQKAKAFRLLNQGRSAQTAAAAREAIVSDPKDPMPYVYLAVALETDGDLDGKQAAYDECATCADHANPNYGNCTQFGGRDRGASVRQR